MIPGGGAATIAFDLHRSYLADGYSVWLAVKNKNTQAPNVQVLCNDAYRSFWAECWFRLGNLFSPWATRPMLGRLCAITHYIGQPKRLIVKLAGHEEFDFPATWHLLDSIPQRPDILHLHNLHENYFDLRALPWLSQQVPVMMTLHDAWLLSGHCAHSFDCQRFMTGCGKCPDLSIYPHILRDGTAYNWQRKRSIYMKSRLYVATPSHWLMEKVSKSMLTKAIVEARVIPNGVDQTIFQPGSQKNARTALAISPTPIMLLFTAHGIRKSPWKDYQTLRSAVALVAKQLPDKQLLFIALGEEAPPEQIGAAEIRFVPYQTNPKAVAQYYQAADIYLHAAKADTFPTVILEALSCGTPVIATAIGGIPEQIEDGVTGFLVPPKDAEAMAARILELIRSEPLRQAMSRQAHQIAKRDFDVERMIKDYLRWYKEIISHYKPESS